MSNLAWLEINLANLKYNITNLKSLLRPGTQFMAVVKSNAYGHGLVKCAQAAVGAGANWIGVVNIAEGLGLRADGIKKPILILGYVELEDVQSAAQNQISIPVVSLDYAIELAKIKLPSPLKVHLKIETGLSRLGLIAIKGANLNTDEIKKTCDILSTNKNIIIEGIYSHMAAVEEEPHVALGQDELLKDIVEDLKKKGIKFSNIHLAASAAIMTLKNTHFDMVRSGISIYGLWPSKKVKDAFRWYKKDFELKPVLTFKTKIIQIKKVAKSHSIGYGRTFRAKRDMIVAIIPVGYYEGLDRRLSNPGGKGEVLILGQRCPIIGRVCMNMTIIDISRLISNFQFPISKLLNEEVIIIGGQGGSEITADEIAEKIGTINYEIVTRIPEHIKRIYK